jgi:chorismate dehydratase
MNVQPKTQSQFRIGSVSYLNAKPLIFGLENQKDLSLILDVPSKLLPGLRDQRFDIALLPVIDYQRLEGLKIVPSGGIGCDGPTLTVRLFSAVPLDKIATLHADTDSHTSLILAQVLLHKLHGVRPRMVNFDARERVSVPTPSAPPQEASDLSHAWPESVLLIGDKVITDHPPDARYQHQLDLGEAWYELTGLPFVYAVWMCRDADVASPDIVSAAALLDRQRRRNAVRLDWIIEKRASEARWPLDQARRYLGQLLRFDVGEREREAVQLFLGEAAALGLVSARQPRWTSEVWEAAHAR